MAAEAVTPHAETQALGGSGRTSRMTDEDPLWIHRPPPGFYGILAGLVAATTGLLALVYRIDGWPQALAILLQVLPAFIFLPPALRTAVVAYPDHLLIRNAGPLHRIRRVRRSRLDGVEVGPPLHPEVGTCVWLRLRGGDLVRMDAMWTHASGPKGMQICAGWAEKLREWSSDRSLDER
jgi:hypothetical protein